MACGEEEQRYGIAANTNASPVLKIILSGKTQFYEDPTATCDWLDLYKTTGTDVASREHSNSAPTESEERTKENTKPTTTKETE
ncbi:hypothetical protein NDU88_006771 [Pleurodeles waltl]|uniref:Uncharacterized protein n=1 Tax=Pleurodeles waltl TaxID=8319 RepID=A0AAV7WFM3_PLEWA|nr:hypothetical protein NDU88_006771 [Pleurodeles waltl]